MAGPGAGTAGFGTEFLDDGLLDGGLPADAVWIAPGEHRIDVGAHGTELFLDRFVVRHATNGAPAIAEGRPPTE